MKPHRVCIHSLHRFHIFAHLAVIYAFRVFQHHIEGKHNIAACKGIAVVKLHAGAKAHNNTALAVKFPAVCYAHRRQQLRINGNKRLKNHGKYVAHAAFLYKQRMPCIRLFRHGYGYLSPALRAYAGLRAQLRAFRHGCGRYYRPGVTSAKQHQSRCKRSNFYY